MSLREAAIGFADRGWPVFPCEPEGKRPLGWLVPHGLKQASADKVVVREWWAQEPRANIGLRTGEGFDVLDVDGPEGLAALEARIPRRDDPDREQSIDGPTVKTGGGGFHVFVAPTGEGNRAKFLPGCDWRGRGGYVIAPPSVHPSGRLYEWFVWDATEPIVRAPAWLLGLLQSRERPVLDSGEGQTATTYGHRALESELGRLAVVPVGERNDALVRAAYRLGQLVAAGKIPAEVVAAQLLQVALRIGLTDREAVATITSGMRAGMTRPRGAVA